jgi:hypothetical protein
MLRYSSAHKKHRANPQQKSFIGLAAASTYNHLKFYVFVILSKDYMFVRGTNPIKLFCGVGVKPHVKFRGSLPSTELDSTLPSGTFARPQAFHYF